MLYRRAIRTEVQTKKLIDHAHLEAVNVYNFFYKFLFINGFSPSTRFVLDVNIIIVINNSGDFLLFRIKVSDYYSNIPEDVSWVWW